MTPVSRRAFLLTAAAAAACSPRRSQTPVERAAAYLWNRQAEDGGFHSSTYGLLRSGQSLTPFVLDVLLDIEDSRPEGGVYRALDFIRKHTDKDGVLGRMDETAADYPNYATALAVSVMVKAKAGENEIARMVAALRVQQFTEENGWKPVDAPYGGWGMGGPIHRPPDAGHVDLSMTRFVLEALHAAGVPSSDPAMTRAQSYLQRSQNTDGGFRFSTINLETNKAGETDNGFASYGTATADGIIALRAAGVPDTDDRIRKALAWLTVNHTPNRVAGFDMKSPRQSWATGLRFYYAAAISKAAPLGLPAVELPMQDPDGSFHNSNNLVKEDDPLIATPFALRAMLSGPHFDI